jgi:hydrogenase-4 membrane subunit HyfE
MSPLLVALVAVLVLPLFIATWRASLLGLGCQGILIALIAYRFEHSPNTLGAWLTLADLAVLRGMLAPLALYTVLRAQNVPARSDVIPPNFLSWTLALGIVLLAFSLAESLVPQTGEQRTLVAVAGAGVMLGFLVLSTQSSPFSQMIGVLRIENAIALLELGGTGHAQPLGLQLGLLMAFVATVAYFRWYLTVLDPGGVASTVEHSGPEGPTL